MNMDQDVGCTFVGVGLDLILTFYAKRLQAMNSSDLHIIQ